MTANELIDALHGLGLFATVAPGVPADDIVMECRDRNRYLKVRIGQDSADMSMRQEFWMDDGAHVTVESGHVHRLLAGLDLVRMLGDMRDVAVAAEAYAEQYRPEHAMSEVPDRLRNEQRLNEALPKWNLELQAAASGDAGSTPHTWDELRRRWAEIRRGYLMPDAACSASSSASDVKDEQQKCCDTCTCTCTSDSDPVFFGVCAREDGVQEGTPEDYFRLHCREDGVQRKIKPTYEALESMLAESRKECYRLTVENLLLVVAIVCLTLVMIFVR